MRQNHTVESGSGENRTAAISIKMASEIAFTANSFDAIARQEYMAGNAEGRFPRLQMGKC